MTTGRSPALIAASNSARSPKWCKRSLTVMPAIGDSLLILSATARPGNARANQSSSRGRSIEHSGDCHQGRDDEYRRTTARIPASCACMTISLPRVVLEPSWARTHAARELPWFGGNLRRCHRTVKKWRWNSLP